MRSRTGATLVEVLVASFVMAIGLISLLALFPLGAIQMAQAIKDDRVAACAANATALATAVNLRHDTFPATSLALMAQAQKDAIAPAFDNPDPAYFLNAAPDGPSYPVLVDPVGFTTHANPFRNWLAGDLWPPSGVHSSIPRRNVSFVELYVPQPTGPQRPELMWFSSLDDLDFDNSGVAVSSPQNPPPGTTANSNRNNLYSWAYLLRRPRNANPSVVEMWVLVYYRRPLPLSGLGGGDETIYSALPYDGKPLGPVQPNMVQMQTPGGIKAPQPGDWLLDCTPGQNLGGKLTPGNARFYRVVGVTEYGTTADVELETPVQAAPMAPRQFALLDGVVEVVYRGTNWLP